MSDEELEELCSESLNKMATDDSYLLHMIIKAFNYKVEQVLKKHQESR